MKNKTNKSYKTKNAYQTGTLCTVIWKINNKKMLSHHSANKIQTINILMFLAQIFIVLKFHILTFMLYQNRIWVICHCLGMTSPHPDLWGE